MKHIIKISVPAYVACTVLYNFLGTATMAWTDFYYTYLSGFVLCALLANYKENKDLLDKFFINYAIGLQSSLFLFFLLCSFNNEYWVYHQTTLISAIIVASFGSILVLWYMIRRTLK